MTQEERDIRRKIKILGTAAPMVTLRHSANWIWFIELGYCVFVVRRSLR